MTQHVLAKFILDRPAAARIACEAGFGVLPQRMFRYQWGAAYDCSWPHRITTLPGADGGVDIIAGTGPMGFGQPRIAVQVKSGATPADVSVLRELQGVMPRFGADHGLIVSWSGFKDSVVREARQLFFEVRLWDSGDLVAALQKNFEDLSEELQAELPLKRIWLLIEPEA